NKEQDVAAFALAISIAEVLGNGQSGERNPGAGTRRFVHLSEYKGRLGFFQVLLFYHGQIPAACVKRLEKRGAIVHDSGLDHFAEEVISFPRPFANTGEYGKS